MKYWLIAFLTALMLAAPIAQGQNVSPGPDAKQMTQMQERMKKMQEQMNRINQTQDPRERQRLDRWGFVAAGHEEGPHQSDEGEGPPRGTSNRPHTPPRLNGRRP